MKLTEKYELKRYLNSRKEESVPQTKWFKISVKITDADDKVKLVMTDINAENDKKAKDKANELFKDKYPNAKDFKEWDVEEIQDGKINEEFLDPVDAVVVTETPATDAETTAEVIQPPVDDTPAGVGEDKEVPNPAKSMVMLLKDIKELLQEVVKECNSADDDELCDLCGDVNDEITTLEDTSYELLESLKGMNKIISHPGVYESNENVIKILADAISMIVDEDSEGEGEFGGNDPMSSEEDSRSDLANEVDDVYDGGEESETEEEETPAETQEPKF